MAEVYTSTGLDQLASSDMDDPLKTHPPPYQSSTGYQGIVFYFNREVIIVISPDSFRPESAEVTPESQKGPLIIDSGETNDVNVTLLLSEKDNLSK